MSIETVIYTIRHGHTYYNAEKRYAGTIDIPLSEKGQNDAVEIGKWFTRMNITFDIVITSTLKRSIQTAQLIVGNKTPIIQNKLCNERNFGIMEGHTWDEVQHLIPPVLFIEVGNDKHSVNPTGGEPFEKVWNRAIRFRRFLFKNYRGKKVLVVSHGVFLQMFYGVIKGSTCIESLANYPANLEVSIFHFLGNRLHKTKTAKLSGTNDVSF